MGFVKTAVETVAKDITFRRSLMALGAITVVAGATFAMLSNEEVGVALESTEPNGAVKTVIVRLKNANYISSDAQIDSAQARILAANDELEPTLGDLAGYHKLVHTMDNFPLAIYEVDAEGEASLKQSPLVKSVFENKTMEQPAIMEMPSPIEAAIDGSYDDGFTDGSNYYDGSGQKIVVIDSGVNKNHVALSGRIVDEACFSYVGAISGGIGSSACASDATVTDISDTAAIAFDTRANAALPCDDSYTSCNHGTMVAASAVMAPMELSPSLGGLPAGTTFETRGVASGAGVVAIKAGTLYDGNGEKRFVPDSVSTLVALDYTYSEAVDDSTIAAVNLSSGMSFYASTVAECKNAAGYADFNDLVGQFRAIGVATFISSGNSGDGENQNRIAAYSCIENAIAVSASKNDGSGVASYANNGPLTDLLAPGGDMERIYANNNTFTTETIADVLWMPNAFDNTQIMYTQGTSFASPMAAGAFAVLREKYPDASVDLLVGLMKQTGKAVVDTRVGYTVGAKPLIQVNAALSANLNNITPDGPKTDPSVTTPEVPNTNDDKNTTTQVPNTGYAPAETAAKITGDAMTAEGSDGKGEAVMIAAIVGIVSVGAMMFVAAKHFELIGVKK